MNTTTKTPIVLIHGLWMTPKSRDTWAERFRAAGHQVIVPGWPGIDDRTVEDIRRNPAALKGIGLKQIADSHFGGSVTPLLLTLVEQAKLTKKNRAAIEKLIQNICD